MAADIQTAGSGIRVAIVLTALLKFFELQQSTTDNETTSHGIDNNINLVVVLLKIISLYHGKQPEEISSISDEIHFCPIYSHR